ncbi:MAG: hypothetical protein H7829_16515 [Magnetococcus sp. THC-1_WYH]
MSKTPSKTAQELLEQVSKAKLILNELEVSVLDARGGVKDAALIRSRLNAAKAHIMRAMEKAQILQ